MMGHTHIAFALLAALLFLSILNPTHPLLFVVLAVFASLLPDVDHEGSKINHLFPVAKWVARLFKHRGFFHSIFPPALLYVLFLWLRLPEIGIAVVFGYVTHLFTDGLTKMGVTLLHPFSTWRVRGFVETGGMVEMVIFWMIVALSLFLIWMRI